jgi:hypothetical protein
MAVTGRRTDEQKGPGCYEQQPAQEFLVFG